MSTPHPRRTVLRSALLGTVAGSVAACTAPSDPTGVPSTDDRHVVELHDDARVVGIDPRVEPSVPAALALLSRSTAVVVTSAAPDDLARGTEVARGLGIPLLVGSPALDDALDRLEVRTVVRVDSGASTATATSSASPSPARPVPTAFGDREVVEAGDSGIPEVAGLPAERPSGSALVVTADGHAPADSLAALVELSGARSVRLAGRDPRADEADIESLRAAGDAVVLGLGRLGSHFAQRVRTVRSAPELPGGGLLPFPGRRMVALYGHPRTGALGMLGEQPVSESLRRARRLADEYEPLVAERVVPAFELIATVASGSAGGDGRYSNRTPVRDLEPWVEAAGEAGIYVVLDLQPGRASFPDQARVYESLLREPHVGLALDPEWRLGPDEKPLQQIGHVDIDEVNETGAWLAALVRDHDLPPKVLTLHQFRTSMIRGRERLDTSLDEIQWLVHADGQGSQDQKQGTWSALRTDLPDGVWLGWKNFEDEDAPMLTPRQTVDQVTPTPWFVSYQ